MKPWLYVGAKLIVARRVPGVWLNRRTSEIVGGPEDGEVVTARRFIERPDCLVVMLEEGWPTQAFDVEDFRPVSTIDTKRAVNEMRSLMLDATVRGKVDA